MEEKAVWIDEEKRILSFHPFENSRMIMKEENIFWDFVFGLTTSGYRVMWEEKGYIKRVNIYGKV